jgi:hypothetical protein
MPSLPFVRGKSADINAGRESINSPAYTLIEFVTSVVQRKIHFVLHKEAHKPPRIFQPKVGQTWLRHHVLAGGESHKTYDFAAQAQRTLEWPMKDVDARAKHGRDAVRRSDTITAIPRRHLATREHHGRIGSRVSVRAGRGDEAVLRADVPGHSRSFYVIVSNRLFPCGLPARMTPWFPFAAVS